MIINRHNYEEIFMLYADNELSAADKQAVEQFVAENTDLKAEFDLMQQLILLPEDDTVSFGKKELLYRLESDEITAVNAEEHFLLYIDNELTAKQRLQVETFVLQNPSVQENFTQLKQMVLPADVVVCPDKDALYKKEEKPVIYLWVRRLAVAAVFFAMAIAVWVLVLNNNSKVLPTGATAAKQNSSPAKINAENKKEAAGQNVNDNFSGNQPSAENNHINDFAAVKKVVQKSNTIITPSVTQERAQEIDTKEAVAVKEVDPVKTVETQQTETSAVNNSTTEVNVSEATKTIEKNNIQVTGEHPETETNYIKQAAYKQLDTDDERKTLYVGAIEINKDKIRGFLRKAGSIFKSKTRTEDDKIQVASFAINTKNPR